MQRSRFRSRTSRGVLAGAFVIAAAALLLAGCGDTVGYSEGSGDKTNGKELFVKGCGSCHILADAGSSGTIGPNLDYAFFQSRKDGLGDETIQQVVRGQIAYPVEDPVAEGVQGMPKDIFKGQDAEDVATYVASVAGLDADNDDKPDAGSGGGPDPNDTDGASLFASQGCGSCHTLAAANSTGSVGPNLDEAKPTRELTIDRVTNGQGGMPAFGDKLSAEQIAALADFVTGK